MVSCSIRQNNFIILFGRASRYACGTSISAKAILLIDTHAFKIWLVKSRVWSSFFLDCSESPSDGTRGRGSHHLSPSSRNELEKLLHQNLIYLHNAVVSPSSLSTTPLLHTDTIKMSKLFYETERLILTKVSKKKEIDFNKPEVSVLMLLNPKVLTLVGVFIFIFFPELETVYQ